MTVEAPNVSGEAGCWSINKPNLTGTTSHRAIAEVDISVASIQYSSAGSRRCSDVSWFVGCLWVVMVMENKLLLAHTRFMDLLPRSKRQ
jgi:hypothetical protein